METEPPGTFGIAAQTVLIPNAQLAINPHLRLLLAKVCLSQGTLDKLFEFVYRLAIHGLEFLLRCMIK